MTSKIYKYVLFIVAMDMITTYLFLCDGRRELNPFADIILYYSGIIGLTIVSFILIQLTYKYYPKALWLFVIVNTLCVLNNFRILML